MDQQSNTKETTKNMAAPQPDSSVISALFSDSAAAREAVRELSEMGIPSGDISFIARDEDRFDDSQLAPGTPREEIGDEALTFRAARELPNDEDLPTTEAAMTGAGAPTLVVTDYEVPPDQPYGGAEQLGLRPDRGQESMVRRNEANTNADADIYTDFPDQPGGINPASPDADRAGEPLQEEMVQHSQLAKSISAGAGIGGIAGLLVGLGGLAIPGIGPFLAAGPLLVALEGLLAGGAVGGIVGALSNIGVPEEYAREYASRIEQGHSLLSVRTTDENRAQVESLLKAQGGQNIH